MRGGEKEDIGSRRMSELRPEVGAAFIESGKSGQGVVQDPPTAHNELATVLGTDQPNRGICCLCLALAQLRQ